MPLYFQPGFKLAIYQYCQIVSESASAAPAIIPLGTTSSLSSPAAHGHVRTAASSIAAAYLLSTYPSLSHHLRPSG